MCLKLIEMESEVTVPFWFHSKCLFISIIALIREERTHPSLQLQLLFPVLNPWI